MPHGDDAHQGISLVMPSRSVDEDAGSHPGSNAQGRTPSGAAPVGRDAVDDQLLRLTAALAVAGATFVMVGGLINYFLLDEAIEDLNPKLEENLLTWFSTVAVFSGALAATLHALIPSAEAAVRRTRRDLRLPLAR